MTARGTSKNLNNKWSGFSVDPLAEGSDRGRGRGWDISAGVNPGEDNLRDSDAIVGIVDMGIQSVDRFP
jgi:hypothetical protein